MNLKRLFQKKSKFELDQNHLQKLAALFDQYDIDKSGTISKEEFKSNFKRSKKVISDTTLDLIYEMNDQEELSKEDFMSIATQLFELNKRFRALDVNGNGALDKEELKVFIMEIGADVASVDDITDIIMREADTDNNGELSFTEFGNLVLQYDSGTISFVDPETILIKSKYTHDNLENFISELNQLFDVDLEDAVIVSPPDSITGIPLQMLLSGASCAIATMFTNPVDVIKVAMQISSKENSLGMLRTISQLYRVGGISSFYRGVTPALMRAFTYSATRLSLYDVMKNVTGANETPTLLRKIAAGICSGSVAAAIANPIEIVKVRMQAEGGRYRSTFHAFREILKTEGASSFLKGITPHILRGAMITSSQIGSYDHIKHFFKDTLNMSEGLLLHFSSSMLAGLITTTVSSPFDVLKTNVMNSSGKSLSVVMKDIYMKNGLKVLFKGWLPNYSRLGPHTVITLMAYEQLRSSFGLGNI